MARISMNLSDGHHFAIWGMFITTGTLFDNESMFPIMNDGKRSYFRIFYSCPTFSIKVNDVFIIG